MPVPFPSFYPSHAGSTGPRGSKYAFSLLSRQNWDTVEKQEEAPSGDELTVMIPRKPQEGPRADSARRAPSLLTRAPAGGDTGSRRKEGESF